MHREVHKKFLIPGILITILGAIFKYIHNLKDIKFFSDFGNFFIVVGIALIVFSIVVKLIVGKKIENQYT